MPRDRSAAALDVVIAVMAFLAALALGASLIAERAAVSWRTGLAGRITVQILPPETPNRTLEAEIASALSVLRSTPGIVHASLVSEQDTRALVRPWLGADALIADLPLPRLIDATLAPGTHVDIGSLRGRLKSAAPDSVLDDHGRWLARLRTLALSIVWSAYAILALIALATAATVSFATRAGLEAHHEIVELLHRMGARAGFIAGAFEWHYCLAALIAGAIGAAAAAALYAANGALEFAGVEAVPFLPPLSLHVTEMVWLLAVPIAASVIALITARLSVLAALRRIY